MGSQTGTTPARVTDLLVLGLAAAPATPLAAQPAEPPTQPLPTTQEAQRTTTEQSASDARTHFVNPIYEGADPWVLKYGRDYFCCQSEGNAGISICRSNRLTDKGRKRIVWKAPARGWNSRQVWAPELHRIDGKWYIYYAASDGNNANHRMGVLEAATDDPQGSYVDRGMLYTGDDVAGGTQNRWAIDGTPLRVGEKLYLVWSGWQDWRDIQHLYIAEMKNPWTVGGNRVRLCANDDFAWERVGENPGGRGLHEGPEVLQRGGRTFIVYSCSSSWEPTYKLGMVYMDNGGDPLDPRSWKKRPAPVFAGTRDVFGIGHASFTRSPDETEDWLVYHTKVSRRPGWERAVCVQPFGWTADGFPEFGAPIPCGKPIRRPSGEPLNQPGAVFADSFDAPDADRWVYYGFERYAAIEEQSLSIGGDPEWGLVNEYRSGEKALVRGYEWKDFSLQVRVRFMEGSEQAGVIFRVQQPGVGYDAQKGYFASLVHSSKRVVLGRMDGAGHELLAAADCPVDGTWHNLRVEAKGEMIHVYVDGQLKLSAEDARYRSGMAGVRVVDTHAHFDDFAITPE